MRTDLENTVAVLWTLAGRFSSCMGGNMGENTEGFARETENQNIKDALLVESNQELIT